MWASVLAWEPASVLAWEPGLVLAWEPGLVRGWEAARAWELVWVRLAKVQERAWASEQA